MCATSIGSTFSHRPVPGERKSGMPEGTEMPAPVSATVRLDERISSARRSVLTVIARYARRYSHVLRDCGVAPYLPLNCGLRF